MEDGLHVLAVSSAWGWTRDEGIDITEIVDGMAATTPAGAALFATDCRSVYALTVRDGTTHREHVGGLRTLLRMPIDVAHVHMVIPPIHLVLAVLLRLRGVRVVCSPMGMLGTDFAAASWFRSRSRARQCVKPALLAVWRRAWRIGAHRFVCVGEEEVRRAALPVERCVLAPFPAPRSELAEALRKAPPTDASHQPEASGADGPVALVSRYDPRRKGFDRVARWVREFADELPHPAVRVFAPLPQQETEVDDTVRQGLIEWDPETRGAGLSVALSRCRGIILLSRWEAQPRVLREAALLGLPTLSTASGNFSDVVGVLGSGFVVDGDRPAEVQTAFLDLPFQPRDPAKARVLFDRDRIGSYLWSLMATVARDEGAPPSYYDVVARLLSERPHTGHDAMPPRRME